MIKAEKALVLILLINSLIWARSAYGKLAGGNFVSGLGGTLDKFASKNPYPIVKDFLQNIAIPNSTTFGQLTLWGEVAVAVVSILSLTYILFTKKYNKWVVWALIGGLLGGIFLNLIFWFSAGWTSSATDSLNLLMFFVQIFGLGYLIKFKGS
ncbi:hypothetical protein HY387_00080 [Candidatus Daviesbacteria bacterium]|nr:hypothetical protein [Candidatus Daviesbacteria bacterium]